MATKTISRTRAGKRTRQNAKQPSRGGLKTFVVFTTIYRPTKIVKSWTHLGHKVIGVGDKKTPKGWPIKGIEFIQATAQNSALANALPWNHYCRKMIGYVRAIQSGADIIIDTDDDNQPKVEFEILPFDNVYREISRPQTYSWLNVYKLFSTKHIWPRGFPLQFSAHELNCKQTLKKCKVGVWQGLADGDPDVDAVYRLTQPTPTLPFEFEDKPPTVLGKYMLCPFNSQNTAFRKELFPLLYLPVVSFRFTDILRSLVAQPIMWNLGYQVGFTKATAIQWRNPHDYVADFESEIPMYLNSERIPGIVTGSIRRSQSISDQMYNAYEALAKLELVGWNELDRLTAWLEAVLPFCRSFLTK
jgi:STELLO glycosyltransferases